jgi:hypothetical protein
MSTARVLSITVEVETSPVTTHFQLRFNVDGSTTWTGYDPSNASPSVPADVSVSTLDASSVYTLDGVNSPTGNTASTSYAGNWYQLRLKSAGGYGDWSVPFKIGNEPDDNGPLADAADLLADFADLKVALDFDAQEQADDFMARLLTDAMDYLRGSPTIETLYTGTRTNAQTRRLSRAERYQAVSMACEKAMVQRATGVFAPLLFEASADLRALAEYFQNKADGLLSIFQTGSTPPPGKPFAKPACSSGTFSYTSGVDRTPSERNLLTDERDDISDQDLETG